jgi:hypothetical protein
MSGAAFKIQNVDNASPCWLPGDPLLPRVSVVLAPVKLLPQKIAGSTDRVPNKLFAAAFFPGPIFHVKSYRTDSDYYKQNAKKSL